MQLTLVGSGAPYQIAYGPLGTFSCTQGTDAPEEYSHDGEQFPVLAKWLKRAAYTVGAVAVCAALKWVWNKYFKADATNGQTEDAQGRVVGASPAFAPMRFTTQDGATDIVVVNADITQQNVDAIVNAANQSLSHGAGVAAAISRAAGPELQQACKQLSLRVGDAVSTDSFRLQAQGIKRIIHAVGPDCVVAEQNAHREQLLYNAYYNSLMQTVDLDNRTIVDIRTIAFPAISTAIFGYPIQEATPVAVRAIEDFVRQYPGQLAEIRLTLFGPTAVADAQVYAQECGRSLLPVQE